MWRTDISTGLAVVHFPASLDYVSDARRTRWERLATLWIAYEFMGINGDQYGLNLVELRMGTWWNMLYLGFDHAIPVCLVFGYVSTAVVPFHHPIIPGIRASPQWTRNGSSPPGCGAGPAAKTWSSCGSWDEVDGIWRNAITTEACSTSSPWKSWFINKGNHPLLWPNNSGWWNIIFFYPDGMMLGGWMLVMLGGLMMVMLGGLMDVGWC